MAVYWLTFRFKEDAGRADRQHRLLETVRLRSSRWWTESASFLLFESAATINHVAAAIRGAIDPRRDLALLGMPHVREARIIGSVRNDDLFALMDFAKET